MSNFINKKYPDAGLLLVRLALGIVFVLAGWAKFQNIAGTTQFFASLGLSQFFVYLVATVEFLGGIALITGIFARFMSLALAVDMFFAIMLAGLSRGFMGYRLEFVLLLSSLAIVVSGAGKIALFFKGKQIVQNGFGRR